MSLICSATIPCCTGEESGNQRITNPKLTENKALNKYLNFLMTKLIVFLIYMLIFIGLCNKYSSIDISFIKFYNIRNISLYKEY